MRECGYEKKDEQEEYGRGKAEWYAGRVQEGKRSGRLSSEFD